MILHQMHSHLEKVKTKRVVMMNQDNLFLVFLQARNHHYATKVHRETYKIKDQCFNSNMRKHKEN